MKNRTALPTFASWLDQLADAKKRDGWLSACQDAGRFLLPCRQLITAPAKVLKSLKAEPVLKVCAGRGELAQALDAVGIPIVATDAKAPAGSIVLRVSTEKALKRYRPAVVLGSSVPLGSRVDEAVLGFPSVQHYIMLGARIGGVLGSEALWQNAAWVAEPLDRVSRWMLTRHDVWMGLPGRVVLQHGEAWHFRRKKKDEHYDSVFDF